MTNTSARKIVAVLMVLFLLSTAQAAVRQVPGGYSSIQQAIDSSSNGDVVLVSPGIYNENINFKGKAITVSSTNAADPNVVSGTVIRAVGQKSAVIFTNGESASSILTGLTISGGYGTINAAFGTNLFWGAGIYCYRSSPTIVGNIITANAAPNNGTILSYGAGIGCIESSATIARNLIAANSAYAGGAIIMYLGQARIVSNVIYSNSATIGGGVVQISGGQCLNNTVVGNSADFAGNVYAVSDTNGQSVVSGNIICNATSGGGIFMEPQDTITQFSFNNVWNNTGGDYLGGTNKTGLNGNISQDPQFVDSTNHDYRLQDISPCFNAGNPGYPNTAGELDFQGSARIYAGRVDIGANEYFDDFRPISAAGPDQLVVVTSLPSSITLDGSASYDLDGVALSYQWTQVSGPAAVLSGAGTAHPAFSVFQLGTYVFRLVVNNGTDSSLGDTVQVTVKNDVPISNAGDDQFHSDLFMVDSISLDGSRSSDPENVSLRYQWRQISGWRVDLSDSNAAKPTFTHPWAGTYVFELVVNDGLQESAADIVTIIIGPNHPPIANAGLSRYVVSGNVTLDGTGSYDLDGFINLTYQWRQVSGPAVTITGTNTARPVVTITTKTSITKCVFELMVSDGDLVSLQSSVTVTIVPNYGTSALILQNPPFDPSRPTIVAFGGGNCTTGSGMNFGSIWEQEANWVTVSSYAPSYTRYGDMLMVFLSSAAPDYRQPIQVIGFSTGNKPAMEIARYNNASYKDARYAINRVSLLDAVCSNLSTLVAQYNTNRIAGEQCWVDNYISNDPAYSRASIIPGAFNIACNPARSHGYPVQKYAGSILDYQNGGITAYGYLSVIGSGKNYQLYNATQKYYFTINSAEAMVFFNSTLYPGKILAPVQLTGPADGTTIDPNGAVFSCGAVGNATGYQLLFGSDPDRVMDFSIVSNTSQPPTQTVSNLPLEQTWWTVRAYDQFGSTIYAQPRLIKKPENRPPIANGGPDQIIYAGLNGTATVILDGSASTDPDGQALGFTWAWFVGSQIYQSNAVSLAIELPIGVHTIQLMVNDGRVNSQPAQVKVTVVGPLECPLKVTPSAINLHSGSPNILVHLRFPEGVTRSEADSSVLPLIYPSGLQATKRWTVGDDADGVGLFASFDKRGLSDELQEGTVELTVVGTLPSGQFFYGSDSVTILEKGKVR